MPLTSTLRKDTLLSNVSAKYRNTKFIADQVFPAVPVKKDSDFIRVFERNFRLPETIRSNRGEAREDDFSVSTSSYLLVQHALKGFVSDRDAENYEISDLRSDTVEHLTDKIMLRMESDVASKFTSTSWSQNVSLAAANQWSLDTTVSNPIIDADSACSAVLQNSGEECNFCILPHDVLLAAKNHQSIIDRIKYTSADITPVMIAGLFDVPQMLVPKAVLDSAAEGATASIAAIWSDNAFFGYKAPRPSVNNASAGYIFKKALPLVKRWREEARQSEAIEVNMMYDVKILASFAGYLIKDCL